MLSNRAERRHPFTVYRRNHQVRVYDLMTNPMFIEGDIQDAWDESTRDDLSECETRWELYTKSRDFPDPWWDLNGNWTDTFELIKHYAH